VALAAYDAPRTLVSATYHIATLTHPLPEVAWAAVAVNVALARFLQGKRDFVPDVIEALRSNEVPAALLAAVRRVPLRTSRTATEDAPGQAVADAEAALWLAYHEPVLERGIRGMATGKAAVGQTGLAGALMGARDGISAIPSAWTIGLDRGNLEALAARLVRADSVLAAGLAAGDR
jgi:ADP-ribosylglycohydrolase